MVSEEGACLSSSQQPPLKQTIPNFQQRKEHHKAKKTETHREKKCDGSVQRDTRHTDQSQKRRPVIWSVELEYYQVVTAITRKMIEQKIPHH